MAVGLPYLFVFFCYLCSGMAFEYKQVVMSDLFLILAAVYWLGLQWPIHIGIAEE